MLRNDESPVAVGKRLKVLRTMAGLNRHALAEQAEVSKTSISYWEHGKGSPMTARSMGKIIAAIEKAGINCNEEWLKTGNSEPPFAISHVKKSSQISESLSNFNFQNSPFIEEINLFLNNHNDSQKAVIVQVEHEGLYPLFQKGDIVGGIFRSADSIDLSKEKICIVKINDKLDIRRIRKKPNTSLFNLSYFSYDSTCSQAFEINNFSLSIIAPILRVWR